MIQVRGLQKSFGPRAVLRGLDLSLGSGRIAGIAGPNACGKSTLMKCLLGLVVPDAGQIAIAGHAVDAGGAFRSAIGYMPQNPQFPGNLRGSEILDMLVNLRRAPAPRREELVEYFELGPALMQPVGEISGGTKQRLAAVIALMFDAPVILLDEPTAGMDPLVSIRFKQRLQEEAAAGKCVVLVSHLLTELEQLASHITFLHDGAAVFSGEIAELLRATGAANLEQALTRSFERRRG